MISRIYCLILCLCFYPKSEAKYQRFYIQELFTNLTKKNITTELFRILAVLVSKFGLENSLENKENEGEEEMKMKEILIENILTNESELTVEGCSQLLCNFQLEGVSFETF